MGDFNLAEAIVEFTSGVETNWNTFNLAIPENIIIFTTDTMKFKRGDGVHKYSDLPESASIAGIAAGSATLVNVLVRLVAGDENKIIIVDNEIYKASGTLITDVLTRINAIQNKDTVQSANLSTVTSQFSMVDPSISGSDDGKLVITKNHQLSPGALPTDISIVIPPSPLHITRNGIYDNIQLSSEPIWLHSSTTYYYKINACHDVVDTDSLSYTLTSDVGADITITNIGRGVFKVVVNAVEFNKSVTFTATAIYNADTVVKSTNKVILGYSPVVVHTSLLAAVYGGTGNDYYTRMAVDSHDNIICVGYTNSEGTGSPTYNDALVVKYDKDLNILSRKIYGDAYSGSFVNLIIDSSNNIICVGSNWTVNSMNAVVVKFDTNLNILAAKLYVTAASCTVGFSSVAIDTNGNIICAGTEQPAAGTQWGLVIKFDSSLNILSRKQYGGTGHTVLNDVVTDSSNNIICAGYTYVSGVGTPTQPNALVIKLDTNLGILFQKVFGGATNDGFYDAVVDSADNIICVGYTSSESTGAVWQALIVKFDSSLNVLAKKKYSLLTGANSFMNVTVDSTDAIICAIHTSTEGVGSPTTGNCGIVKLDTNLNIVSKKLLSGSAIDVLYGIATDSDDNIVCAGYTDSDGAGAIDALVFKCPSTIPSGTFIGTVLTGFTLSDSTFALTDSALTASTSALVAANTVLTLSASTLTLAASNLSSEIEDFGTGGFIYRDIMAAVYGGTGDNHFTGVAVDSEDNIICVGHTIGASDDNCIIVKFDANLNILTNKTYNGIFSDFANRVAVDSNDNIILAGQTVSEGVNLGTDWNALVIKFDANLNILARKVYGGGGADTFEGVTVDSANNIICVGQTNSEGTGSYDALVVKFDSNLNILARKIYGGAYHDGFRAVTVDSNDNIICAGYTSSEGGGSPTRWDALVVKFDTNLNILARKIYGGANDEQFYTVTVDSNDNIICVGQTNSEGTGAPTYSDVLVVKFDTNLNILARKIYGGAGNDTFYWVTVDSANNIICVGWTYSEGTGAPTYNDALVVKFDTNLNILARKIYGGAGNDMFTGVAVDSADNLIGCGYTQSEGAGGYDALVIKLPATMPIGTFVGTVLTGLTLSDSNLTLANSALTLANSTLTLANSTLTLADSALTLANSTLTLEKDLIIL